MNMDEWTRQDCKEFVKLFGIRCPVLDPVIFVNHFNLLTAADEWRDQVVLAEEFDRWKSEGSVGDRKHAFVDAMVRRLKDDGARLSVRYLGEIQRMKTGKQSPIYGRPYVQVDLKEANYAVFRGFNSRLPGTWAELVADTGCDAFLGKSKGLRQHVMGLLNPKRQQQVQAEFIRRLKIALEDVGWEVVLVSPDELFVLRGSALDQRDVMNVKYTGAPPGKVFYQVQVNDVASPRIYMTPVSAERAALGALKEVSESSLGPVKGPDWDDAWVKLYQTREYQAQAGVFVRVNKVEVV